MKKLLTIYDTQNPDVVFQRKGYPPLDPAKQTATNIKGTAAKKKFKGENIEKTNFKNKDVISKDDVPGNEEYKGYVKTGTEYPHGEGTYIFRNKDKSIYSIEKGIFENGLLINGTEIEYWDWCIHKTIGKWKWHSNGNRHERISGKGEELYYKSESDMKKNKPFGYMIGTFDDGMILKGEVFKPFQINYTSSDFVKKILIKKIYKNTDYLTEYTNGNLENGEIFFENGDHYKGEFSGDMPHGMGTMTYKDDSKVKGRWHHGNIAEDNQ